MHIWRAWTSPKRLHALDPARECLAVVVRVCIAQVEFERRQQAFKRGGQDRDPRALFSSSPASPAETGQLTHMTALLLTTSLLKPLAPLGDANQSYTAP